MPPPELRAAERAFERGDFYEAARRARTLGDAPDASTRAAAREMLDRFRTDPVVVVLMSIALVLLALSFAHYLRH
jgi:hypothetical protein